MLPNHGVYCADVYVQRGVCTLCGEEHRGEDGICCVGWLRFFGSFASNDTYGCYMTSQGMIVLFLHFFYFSVVFLLLMFSFSFSSAWSGLQDGGL